MSIESTSTASRLEEFENHLRTARYAAAIQRRYLWIAQRFVDYLGKKCIAVEAGPCAGVRRLPTLGASLTGV